MTPAKRIWVEKTEEKSSDVNITSHLVRDACFKRFDVAVLITNDSDLPNRSESCERSSSCRLASSTRMSTTACSSRSLRPS